MARLRKMLKINRSECGNHERTAEKFHKKYSAAGKNGNVAYVTAAEEPRNHGIAEGSSRV